MAALHPSSRLIWIFFTVALFLTLAARGLPAVERNALALRLATEGLPTLTRWHDPATAPLLAAAPDDPCSLPALVGRFPEAESEGCGDDAMRQLWGARQAWRAGDVDGACDEWRSLDAPVEPWRIVQDRRGQGASEPLAAALGCLDRWEAETTTGFGTVYAGWVAEAWRDLGNDRAAAGEAAAALHAFDRATQWSPVAWGEPAARGAELLVAQGQPDAALAWLDDALATLPAAEAGTRYVLLVQQAEIAHAAGQTERAIAALQAARASVPDNPHPYQRIAGLYRDRGQWEAAATTLRAGLASPAAATETARRNFWVTLGESYQQGQQWGDAFCAYQAALDLAPDEAARTALATVEAQLTGEPQCSAP